MRKTKKYMMLDKIVTEFGNKYEGDSLSRLLRNYYEEFTYDNLEQAYELLTEGYKLVYIDVGVLWSDRKTKFNEFIERANENEIYCRVVGKSGEGRSDWYMMFSKPYEDEKYCIKEYKGVKAKFKSYAE